MQEVPEIDVHAAKEALDGQTATFVDIRDPGSHAAAHIPGCRHITSQDDVDALCNDVNDDTPLIVYCYKGNASKGATAFFLEKGFNDVRSMAGGFAAWSASQYDVEQ